MSEGIVSANLIQNPRKERVCNSFSCGKPILPGEPTVRLYGCAWEGDPLYNLYLHLECARKSVDPELLNPKIQAVIQPKG